MTEPVDRVALVMDEWANRPELPGEPYVYQSTNGPVIIEQVEAGEQGGIPFVEVLVADPVGGDPTFRVFNPPALVLDPVGDVERGGQRYRFDPVAALAESVGTFGGSAIRKGRAA